MTAEHPYRGRRAALATKHDKLSLVGPALALHTGLEVVHVAVDTDVLGTFTGEVPRVGSPWETAVAKARLAMAHSGLSIGIASEGTFGPLEGAPFVQADRELVVLVDDEFGIEVGEVEVGIGLPTLTVDVSVGADGLSLDLIPLERAGFPEHGLIVRPVGSLALVVKGIHSLPELERAIARCAEEGCTATVRVESDLRANHHPSRREVIARAAERLALRLASCCPSCGAPGWGVGRRDAGAPCAECGMPTRVVRCEHWVCAACDHEEQRLTIESAGADPAHCPRCNP